MGRKLATNVAVGGVVHPAGSTPPAEVAEQITNPKAWAEPEPDGDEKPAAKKAAGKRSSSK